MSKAAVGYLAHGITLTVSMSGCQYLLEFCWNSVGILLVILIGDYAVFPDGTQIKQRALLVEFGDCALKV